MKNKIYQTLVKAALKLHNFSYKLSTFFAVKAEGGLHPKHRIMNYHKFFVDNINASDIVLDIGCGNGALDFDVAQKAKKVVGIDLNKQNIEIAKKKYFAPNIKYLVGNATEDLPAQKFNVIILSNVLEHINDRVDFLRKIKDLAPKILIRVPMINRDWITLYKKELGIEWRLDKNHYTEYTLESFKKELSRAELNLENYSIQFGEIWAVVRTNNF